MGKINKIKKEVKITAPFGWFGGKGVLKSKILPILAKIPHTKYVEVFGGAASVLFGKKPCALDVYNDIDSSLYDFFTVISNEKLFVKLQRRVESLPYSRQIFYEYRKNWKEEKDLVERVAQWFTFVNQCFSADQAGGWSYDSRVHGSISISCNRWMRKIANLSNIHKRLRTVQIEKNDFRKILKTYDCKDTLFYLDPPYFSSQRSGGKYNYEINNLDHVDMIDLLLSLKGKAVISGYKNIAYERLERNNFMRKDFNVSCVSAGRTALTGLKGEGVCKEKQKRIESLWLCPKSTKFFLTN